MGAATDAFLARIGLGAGWRCLDVGCGDGQVTLALARPVGPGGWAGVLRENVRLPSSRIEDFQLK